MEIQEIEKIEENIDTGTLSISLSEIDRVTIQGQLNHNPMYLSEITTTDELNNFAELHGLPPIQESLPKEEFTACLVGDDQRIFMVGTKHTVCEIEPHGKPINCGKDGKEFDFDKLIKKERNSEYNYWVYNDRVYDKIHDENIIGFVYLITRLNLEEDQKSPIYYYGKKNFLKKQKNCYKESDWKIYTGSSELLNEHIDLYGIENFKKEIIEFCYSSMELTYKETKMLFEKNVLRYDNDSIMVRKYYNRNILGKFHSNELFTKDDLERIQWIRKQPFNSFARILVNNGEISKFLNLEIYDLNEWLISNPDWVVGSCGSTSTKEKICCTNGEDNIFIDKIDLEYFLIDNPDWYIGSKIKNKFVSIYKENIIKRVLKTEVDKFISEGWDKGRKPESEHLTKKIKISIIHRELCLQMIIYEELFLDYEKDGWEITPPNFGVGEFYCWVNKDNFIEKIKLIDLNNYLRNGWSKGRGLSYIKNKICINNNSEIKFVQKDELYDYLRNGWLLGGLNLGSLKERDLIYVCNDIMKKNKLLPKIEVDDFLKNNSDWRLGQFKRERFTTQGLVFVYDIENNYEPKNITTEEYKVNKNKYILRKTHKIPKLPISTFNLVKRYWKEIYPKRALPKFPKSGKLTEDFKRYIEEFNAFDAKVKDGTYKLLGKRDRAKIALYYNLNPKIKKTDRPYLGKFITEPIRELLEKI